MSNPVTEWHEVDATTFREQIFPRNRPAVLRGAVREWPAVGAGLKSPAALVEYLLGLDQGEAVPLITAPARVKGRFFYREDMCSPNFERRTAPLAAGLRALLGHLDDAEPPAIYVESAPVPQCLPTFTRFHTLALLDSAIAPRIWIGNKVTVQTHFDFYSNIACVVAGRRHFTLFPPEQLANLYPSSLDVTLAGVPVSMVSPDAPDHDRYPRFHMAQAHAQVVELGPGDALFIPYGWWHRVESLAPLNVLVNYWWDDNKFPLSPMDSLLHAVFAFRELSSEQRAVWRNLFDYYAFQTSGDPLGHLPAEIRGLMGEGGEQALRTVRALLLRSLGGT
ncbi:MAG: cupin-like domain-containing protein [Steroidobacteraceae bacterium]